MTDAAFRGWLEANYSPNSVAVHMSCLRKVADAYGDLDGLFEEDGPQAVLEALTYSASDAAAGRPNPSRLTIGGSLHDRLPGFKSAVRCYIKYKAAEPVLVSEAAIERAAATIAIVADVAPMPGESSR